MGCVQNLVVPSPEEAKPLRVGSLFSGIGGIDLGLERAGMKVVWQSDIDPYASAVLKKHWPSVPNLGDITKIDWSEVEREYGPVDVLCGGFPCQPVSVAGGRKGEKDERWLWPEYARAIRSLRPRRIFAENVPGLLTASGGGTAETVFWSLAELGYDAEWASIPAAAFGAPQLRYRVVILAYPNNESSQLGRVIGNMGGKTSSDEGASEERQRFRHTANDGCKDVAGARFRFFESIVGGEPYGLPSRLDGTRWPSRPGEDQRPWEAPRTAVGVASRKDRLRALGNAVVPQMAEWVGGLILSAAEVERKVA